MKKTMHIDGSLCQAKVAANMETWPIHRNRFCKRLFLLVCCGMMAASSFGQQALGQRPRVNLLW